ncbi:MAG: hypothetical protein AAF682_10780 [Planctomycetota bacterium]
MKNPIRLENERLADALIDRELVQREAIALVLQQVAATGAVFTEILVQENLVSDWEVSRVSADVFSLPFAPVEVSPPNKDLLDDLDPEYLRLHNLVPIERFGDVLTIAMPGIVPTSVLTAVSNSESVIVLPVVGSVVTNRNWITEHLPAPDDLESMLPAGDSGWADIFDAGEEAVQLNMPGDEEESGGMGGASDSGLGTGDDGQLRITLDETDLEL